MRIREHLFLLMHKQKLKSGFTMVELVIVIVLVAILASICVTAVSSIIGTTRTHAAEAEMEEIMLAILGDASSTMSGFFDDMGRVPSENEGYGLDELAEDIDGVGYDLTFQKGWNGPYIDTTDSDGNGVYDMLEDPWGNAYVYDDYQDTVGVNVWDMVILRSMGPDGVDDNGGDDDIEISREYRSDFQPLF